MKIPGYSHRSILVGDFSADLRASALAMLISNPDLLPGPNDATCRETNDPERVHQEKPGAQALRSKVQIAESPHRRRRAG